jgi:hypothetical protein
MIKLTSEVIRYTAGEKDKWGISSKTLPETIPAKVDVKLKIVDNTIVPEGSILLKGKLIINMTDKFQFTAYDGKTYEVVPKSMKVIKDTSGKILFTKVSY